MQIKWVGIYRPISLLGCLLICITACGLKHKPTKAPIPIITQLAQTSTPSRVKNTPTFTIPVTVVNDQDLPPEIRELLKGLNNFTSGPNFITVETDECPNLHPNYIDLGQVNSILDNTKQNLVKLKLGHFYFQYDCTQMQYRVVVAVIQPRPICSCQP